MIPSYPAWVPFERCHSALRALPSSPAQAMACQLILLLFVHLLSSPPSLLCSGCSPGPLETQSPTLPHFLPEALSVMALPTLPCPEGYQHAQRARLHSLEEPPPTSGTRLLLPSKSTPHICSLVSAPSLSPQPNQPLSPAQSPPASSAQAWVQLLAPPFLSYTSIFGSSSFPPVKREHL